MTHLEFISALVEHVLSWPVAAVVMFLTVRKAIAHDAIPRLRSWEGKGGKLLFSEGTQSAIDAVESLEAAEKVEAKKADGEPRPHRPPILLTSSVEQTPAEQIAAAYALLEGAVGELTGVPGARDVVRELFRLEREGIVTGEFVQAVGNLRRTRNRVMDGSRTPSFDEANNYRIAAGLLTRSALDLVDQRR